MICLAGRSGLAVRVVIVHGRERAYHTCWRLELYCSGLSNHVAALHPIEHVLSACTCCRAAVVLALSLQVLSESHSTYGVVAVLLADRALCVHAPSSHLILPHPHLALSTAKLRSTFFPTKVDKDRLRQVQSIVLAPTLLFSDPAADMLAASEVAPKDDDGRPQAVCHLL